MILKLRAHHLLCIHGWRGRGYSQPFIDAMNDVIKRLSQEDVRLLVIDTYDRLCVACPHLVGSACCKDNGASEARIADRDRAILATLGLARGAVIPADEALSLARRKISPGDLENLCSTCAWLRFGWCADGLARGELGQAAVP